MDTSLFSRYLDVAMANQHKVKIVIIRTIYVLSWSHFVDHPKNVWV
jgi:hypothetical protein